MKDNEVVEFFELFPNREILKIFINNGFDDLETIKGNNISNYNYINFIKFNCICIWIIK